VKANLVKYEHTDSYLIKDLVRGTVERSHSHQLDELYSRLDFFDGSLKVCFWYLFWHAVMLNNKARNHLMFPKSVQKKLDPTEPGSPTSKVLKKKELISMLKSLRVYGSGRSAVFKPTLIEKLYDQMKRVESITLEEISNTWKNNVLKTKAVLNRTAGAKHRQKNARNPDVADRKVAEQRRIEEEEKRLQDQNSRICSSECSLM